MTVRDAINKALDQLDADGHKTEDVYLYLMEAKRILVLARLRDKPSEWELLSKEEMYSGGSIVGR